MPREQREQLMLDAAGQVFARGYHSASMDEIAELADVSKPLLYAYFDSKEGLYIAYINRTGRELLGRLNGASRRERHTLACLRALITAFLTFVEDHRDAWIVLFGAMTASRPVAAEVAELRHQTVEVVRHLLEGNESSRSASGGLASAATAHAIVGAGESLANWWLEHPEVPRDEVADIYLELARPAFAAARRPRMSNGANRPTRNANEESIGAPRKP
jgi:AcrR family transcriptional regulator